MDWHGLKKETKPLDDLLRVDSFSAVRQAGYVPFSLGPVYVYAGVNESLVDSFRADARDDVAGRPNDLKHTTMKFDHVVVSNCPGWENVIDIMDYESYQWFKKWALSLNFTDRAKRTFYLPRHYLAPVLDPVALGLSGKRVPETLEIYALSGMRGNMKPVSWYPAETDMRAEEIVGTNPDRLDKRAAPLPYIKLAVAPPEEDVQVLGRKMLDVIKET